MKKNTWLWPLVGLLVFNMGFSVILERMKHTENVEVIVIKSLIGQAIIPLIALGIAAFVPGRDAAFRCKVAFWAAVLVTFGLIGQTAAVSHT